jgi:solute carrier family 25 carnitine/acylcarnitine transporter 20/29
MELHDFACGTFGGVCSKLVDYPLDTIKVRLQSQTATQVASTSSESVYSGALDCFTKIMRKEGFKGFYTGIGAPIFGAGAENAASFLGFGIARRQLCRYWGLEEDGSPLPLSAVFLAGAFSGIGAGTVLTPIELLKCRLQANQQSRGRGEPVKFVGLLGCIRHTVQHEGPKALLTGLPATLAREIPGNAAWFTCYEASTRLFIPKGKTKEDCPFWVFPLCGGFAGVGFWSAFYPADTVKTRMQISPEWNQFGFRGAFLRIWREGGIRALYAGYPVTILRAFPGNATCFSGYEALSSIWPK